MAEDCLIPCSLTFPSATSGYQSDWEPDKAKELARLAGASGLGTWGVREEGEVSFAEHGNFVGRKDAWT
jgi:hypothetical protein